MYFGRDDFHKLVRCFMIHIPMKEDQLIDNQRLIQPGILPKNLSIDWYNNQLIENSNYQLPTTYHP